MESVKRFITDQLKLKVNESKSAVAKPQERKFLAIQLYGRKAAQAQNRAASGRPIQRAGPGNHASEPGEEHGEGDGGTGPVFARLARLFRLL
jgi:hypothetical protein